MSDAGKMYTINAHGAISANEDKVKQLNELVDSGSIVDFNTERKFSTARGPAEMVISDDYVVIASDESTAIGVGDGSIMMVGRVHLTKAPSDIRVNGFWVFNEELLTSIPSTLFNPVPTLLYKAPPFAKNVSKFAQLMSAFGI